VIYLAAPYSGMEQLSFEVSCMVAAFLMKTGKIVYSPVVYGHTLASKYDLPTDNEFWLTQDLDLLCRCDELYVITLEGWDKSSGVADEINEAQKMECPLALSIRSLLSKILWKVIVMTDEEKIVGFSFKGRKYFRCRQFS